MTEKTNVTRELTKLQKSVTDLREEVSLLSKIGNEKRSPKKSLWSRFRQAFGFAADVFSLILPAATIYLAFSNFISIPPTHSMQLNDPLTIPFTIQNNSYVNLRNLKVVVRMLDVNGDAGATVKNITFENVGIVENIVPSMKSNSSHTLIFHPDRIFAPKLTKITRADVQIYISYKALFFTKEFNQQFRFIALPGQEGFYEYYPVQSKL